MSHEPPLSPEPTTLASLRRILLAILMLGMAGTTTELLLLKHDEGAIQLVPLALIGAGYVIILWHVIDRGRVSVRSLQALMILFVASGIAGIVFHYRANVEFQLETDPALQGATLAWKVLQAKSPPALAPGVMAQLGLIGLTYAYRHPALARAARPGDRDDAQSQN
jgi:hypothetical protein